MCGGIPIKVEGDPLTQGMQRNTSNWISVEAAT